MDLLFEAATGLAQAKRSFISVGSSHHSPLDSSLFAGWESSRHCNGLHIPPFGGENIGETIRRDFQQDCSPFQYALSTRAGTDCVGHLHRAATDASPSQQFSVLMGLALTSMCCERPCWEDWSACHVPTFFSHLCGFRTLSFPRTVGSMTKESGRWSHKQRGEHGDPLMPCHCCFQLAYKGLLKKSADP